MRFEWDEQKNRRNRVKHKVSFETAKVVFDDPGRLAFKTALLGTKSGGRPSAWPVESSCWSLTRTASKKARR